MPSSVLPSTCCPIVGLQTPLASGDHLSWRRSCLLCEHVTDDDRVVIDTIDDPPLATTICDPQLVTASSDGRHRAGVRKTERLSSLKSPEGHSHLDPSLLRERRCLDLAMEPSERFVPPHRHRSLDMSDMTSKQHGRSALAARLACPCGSWESRFG